CSGKEIESASKKNSRLRNTRRTIPPNCCIDRLNPQSNRDIHRGLQPASCGQSQTVLSSGHSSDRYTPKGAEGGGMLILCEDLLRGEIRCRHNQEPQERIRRSCTTNVCKRVKPSSRNGEWPPTSSRKTRCISS